MEGGENSMENSGAELSLAGKDKVASPDDREERSFLEDKLCWTRLELQNTLALSADADETICKLTTVARTMMQERDEVRNQGKMLLAEFQARNAQLMPTGRACSKIARPDVFAITSYNPALVPAAVRPFSGMMQDQYARTGPSLSYCFASSNDLGHRNLVSSLNINPVEPSFHDFTSSSQEGSFDPDMFLVDAAESLQDSVPTTASPGPSKNSGAFDLAAKQIPLPREGKLKQTVCDAGPLLQSVMDAGPSKVNPSFTKQRCSGAVYNRAAVVKTAGKKHTS